MENPFHPGELLVQQRAGEREIAERNGSMIADTLTPGAISFLREQSMLVVGSGLPGGDLWASVLFGPPGFVEAADGKTLQIHLGQGDRDDADDPFWQNFARGEAIGALAIDLATRRRLRLNGRVAVNVPGLLSITLEEAYPNCPKYIQRRILKRDPDGVREPRRIESGTSLADAARQVVERADTLFVASSNPSGGADVSHRGGSAGFVSVVDEHTLRVPDYRGNGMFNTLGNFALNPAAGILIIDFANLRTLQMTGTARLEWSGASSEKTRAETERSWTFHVKRWVLRPLKAAVQWQLVDFSPYNPR